MKKLTKFTIKIFWEEIRKSSYIFSAIIFCVIVAVLFDLVVPVLLKDFFDVLVEDSSVAQKKGQLITILLWMAASLVGMRLFWAMSDYLATALNSRNVTRLYQRCFDYLHRHSVSFFHDNFVGSLVKRVNIFVWANDALVNMFFWDLLPLTLFVVGISVVLALQSVLLSVIIIVWTIFILITTYIYSRIKYPIDVKLSKTSTTISGHVADTVTNHENVKFFSAANRESKTFAEILGGWLYVARRSWFLDGHFRLFQGMALVVLQVGIMYFAVLQWEKGLFTVGDFVLIQTYVVALAVKIWELKHIIRNYYKNTADAQEMTEIFLQPHAIKNKRGAKDIVVKKGKISFQSVGFAYKKTREIFKRLNLDIKPGQKIALVGHSGAGKSTAIKLLMRQHDLSSGKILIDGQSIADVTLESLWDNLSFVPQDSILFHRSLMENIRYGRPEASDEEVIEAAKLARVHEFVSELPDKYKTYVGERGVKLSGGERQRVAIARAILRDAPILVLDEATSSLDSESEALIQEALETLMKDKTVLVIAHRLSTIQKMDRILVFEGGNIIEDGSHKQLLRKKAGTYKKFWDMQAGGFIVE